MGRDGAWRGDEGMAKGWRGDGEATDGSEIGKEMLKGLLKGLRGRRLGKRC